MKTRFRLAYGMHFEWTKIESMKPCKIRPNSQTVPKTGPLYIEDRPCCPEQFEVLNFANLYYSKIDTPKVPSPDKPYLDRCLDRPYGMH